MVVVVGGRVERYDYGEDDNDNDYVYEYDEGQMMLVGCSRREAPAAGRAPSQESRISLGIAHMGGSQLLPKWFAAVLQ